MTDTIGPIQLIEARDHVPDGRYPGLWTASLVTFVADGRKYAVETVACVKGINCPCTVVVKDGKATIEENPGHG